MWDTPKKTPEFKQRTVAILLAILAGVFTFFFSREFEFSIKSIQLNSSPVKFDASDRAAIDFAAFVNPVKGSK